MPMFIRTDDNTKRIVKIEFVQHQDDCPDLSNLGEYHAAPREGSIDRQARGDMKRGECRYFTPAMTGEETGNPDSPEQDYQRYEAYNRGEWHMTFCQAKATVSVHGVMQTITSGGLAGVESDSDASYFKEIEAEQREELNGILTEFGFNPAK
jgi:hypothetical protein